MAYIYKIQNIKNGKYYIGSANNFEIRKKQHINDLNKLKHHNYLLQRDWNYYGDENFKFTVLEVVPDDQKFQKEQEYLDLLVGKENEIYNICRTSVGSLVVLSFHPYTRKCKVCKKRFKTYDLKEYICSVDCEMKYDCFSDEYDHPEDYNWKNSCYEYKNIEDWDVDDFTAADWDDRWSK